jgi:hypothetical protein
MVPRYRRANRPFKILYTRVWAAAVTAALRLS